MDEQHRQNTNETECPCRNNYTSSTFYESFGKDDEDLKRCSNCPNFSYDCGLATCSKFK